MSSIITPCSICTEWEDPAGKKIAKYINKRTTPEEFERRRKESPSYLLKMGCRGSNNVLCLTASQGNIGLVEYIVTISQKKLLNVGNGNGCTPLFCAVLNGRLGVVNKLIELGANVNISTIKTFRYIIKGTEEVVPPLNATPLWNVASQIICNFAMVKLLLRNNAIASPDLGAHALLNIKKAKEQMEAENLLFSTVIDQDSGSRLPIDLIKIIERYANCFTESENYLFDDKVIKEDEEKKMQYEPPIPTKNDACCSLM